MLAEFVFFCLCGEYQNSCGGFCILANENYYVGTSLLCEACARAGGVVVTVMRMEFLCAFCAYRPLVKKTANTQYITRPT